VLVTYQPALEQLLVAPTARHRRKWRQERSPTRTNHPAVPGRLPGTSTSTSTFRRCAAPASCRPSRYVSPSLEDAPDKPAGDLYLPNPRRTSLFNVRGARNYPCLTRPGKYAPTVKMCESDPELLRAAQRRVELEGRPETRPLSGQDIPQLPPRRRARARYPGTAPGAASGRPPSASGERPRRPPLAVHRIRPPPPANYVGPDGPTFTTSPTWLKTPPKEHTWQTMVMPPTPAETRALDDGSTRRPPPAEPDNRADVEFVLDEADGRPPSRYGPACRRHTLRLALTATTVAVVALGAPARLARFCAPHQFPADRPAAGDGT